MKFITVLLFCLLTVQIGFGQSKEFYDKVLNNFNCMYCPIIVIDVESAEYTGRVTIDNGELFSFLNKTKGLNEKDYKDFVKKILVNSEKLKLDNFFLSDSKESLITKGANSIRFEIVKDSKEIDEIAAKGKEEFIKQFFRKPSDTYVINSGIKNWNPIINKLFEWQIATSIDDESGFLIIDEYRSAKLF